MKLFALIVLVLAGSFSVMMVIVFSIVLAARGRTITVTDQLSMPARLLMLFAAIANVAIVLLYMFEWNC